MSQGSRIGTALGAATLPLVLIGDEHKARIAAGLGTAISTPLLLNEIEASWQGRKMLQEAAAKTGHKMGFLKSLGPFKGVPTYALAAATPAILYKYLQKKKLYKKSKK
jgi:hypothetical protein